MYDERDGKMPLAYVHFVQCLVDLLCATAPLALFPRGGAFGIALCAVIALFFGGVVELSKAFLARFALQYVTVNQPVVAEWQGDERAGGAALSGRFSEARRSRPRRRQPEADRHEPRGDPAGAGHRERRAQRRRSSPRPQQLLLLPPPMLRRGMPC